MKPILADLRDVPEASMQNVPQKMRRYVNRQRPIEMRPVESVDLLTRAPREPHRHLWIRTVDDLPDDSDLHRNLLAYISDYQLVGTTILPHGIRWEEDNVQMASLDHAMWFHRPFRADRWLLYCMESPNASGSRGLTTGRFYDENGKLVASTAQEGLIRIWPQAGE